MLMSRRIAFALAATGLVAASASAQDGPLLDYRDHAFLVGSAFYSQAERAKIAAALAAAPDGLAGQLGDEFAILGDAEGAFTAPDAEETIYLVQESAPVAIDPFPEGAAPVLVAMRGDEAVGFFRLPDDVQYQRLVAAADGTGDGRAEVLLETSFMNMGQSVTSLDVVSLGDDGAAKPVETIGEVYVDACENPAGERSRSASTISVGADGFTAEKHEIACGE